MKYFTPLDLEEYLKIEAYHSLDKYGLGEPFDITLEYNEREDFDPRTFLSLLKRFYGFLAGIRYSLHPHPPEKKYNDFVENHYDVYINRLNYFILKLSYLFGPTKKQDANLFEDIVIFNFYDCIQENLKKLILRRRKRSVSKPEQHLPSQIRKLFVMGQVTRIERQDTNLYNRLLQHKQQRYNGDDRAKYWRERIAEEEKDTISFKNARSRIENMFIRQDPKETSLERQELMNSTIAFVLLLLTKYHLVLHRYAHGAYEFRTLSQHLDAEDEKITAQIERSQKIFTFTRLIAKYFPLIFASGNTHSKAIAKTIEVLSYVRRGTAYLSLGKIEKAFNDYTSAEKQLRLLQEMHNKCKKEFINLYYELITPYIFSLKGELYRRNHAFYNAHQYFCNAVSRFEDNKVGKCEESVKTCIGSSLKIVRLKLLKGKTFLELGEFRKSLKWYLKALEHVLKILRLVNEEIFSNVFDYLEETRLDPKLIKGDTYKKFRDLTNGIEKIVFSKNHLLENYGILLSDLLNRISLVLFLLNLPDYERTEVVDLVRKDRSVRTVRKREILRNDLSRNQLAWRWLELALNLNPSNSLAQFNKLAFGLNATHEEAKPSAEAEKEEVEIGGLRDIKYRRIARETLENFGDVRTDSQDQDIAKALLQRLLLHTQDFSIKNAELYKYLMKPRHESIQHPSPNIYFYALQRWSSINPALPRPSAFRIKGGGYFVIFKGKGIAIDPGLNFVENLYSEGFSIADIDYVIATHDHIDHIADLDTILALHYRRYKLGERKCVTLLLNPSVSSRYSHVLQQDPELFRKIELSRGMEMPLEDFGGDLIVEPKRAEHFDLTSPKVSHSIGIVLVFYPRSVEEARIGITSDTKRRRSDSKSEDLIINQYLDVDILIVHVNSATFKHLIDASKIDLPQEVFKIEGLTDEEFAGRCPIDKEIYYSLGFRSKEDDHLLLDGVLEAYHKFEEGKKNNSNRLFIISEISEEMGSYRHKIATLINKRAPSRNMKCLTADIGMAIRIKPSEPKQKIQVRCSRCNLNNDYTEDDKFHFPEDIKEVCLKREEEGIFYYCRRHDPEGVIRKSVHKYGFSERIERYQPFKHVDIPIT